MLEPLTRIDIVIVVNLLTLVFWHILWFPFGMGTAKKIQVEQILYWISLALTVFTVVIDVVFVVRQVLP